MVAVAHPAAVPRPARRASTLAQRPRCWNATGARCVGESRSCSVPSPAGSLGHRDDDAPIRLYEILLRDALYVGGGDLLDARLALGEKIRIVVEHGVLRHPDRALQ